MKTIFLAHCISINSFLKIYNNGCVLYSFVYSLQSSRYRRRKSPDSHFSPVRTQQHANPRGKTDTQISPVAYRLNPHSGNRYGRYRKKVRVKTYPSQSTDTYRYRGLMKLGRRPFLPSLSH